MDTRKWVVNKQYIRNGNYKLLDELVSEYYRLEDENKRLKEALIDISVYWNLQPESAFDAAEECRKIANEALRGGE